MEYFYYVTEEKRRWWAKEKFAKDFCDLLKRFEKSHVDIQMGYGESSILRDDFISQGNIVDQLLSGKR